MDKTCTDIYSVVYYYNWNNRNRKNNLNERISKGKINIGFQFKIEPKPLDFFISHNGKEIKKIIFLKISSIEIFLKISVTSMAVRCKEHICFVFLSIEFQFIENICILLFLFYFFHIIAHEA